MRKKTCLPVRVAEGDAQGWHVGVVGALQDSGSNVSCKLSSVLVSMDFIFFPWNLVTC